MTIKQTILQFMGLLSLSFGSSQYANAKTFKEHLDDQNVKAADKEDLVVSFDFLNRASHVAVAGAAGGASLSSFVLSMDSFPMRKLRQSAAELIKAKRASDALKLEKVISPEAQSKVNARIEQATNAYIEDLGYVSTTLRTEAKMLTAKRENLKAAEINARAKQIEDMAQDRITVVTTEAEIKAISQTASKALPKTMLKKFARGASVVGFILAGDQIVGALSPPMQNELSTVSFIKAAKATYSDESTLTGAGNEKGAKHGGESLEQEEKAK